MGKTCVKMTSNIIKHEILQTNYSKMAQAGCFISVDLPKLYPLYGEGVAYSVVWRISIILDPGRIEVALSPRLCSGGGSGFSTSAGSAIVKSHAVELSCKISSNRNVTKCVIGKG